MQLFSILMKPSTALLKQIVLQLISLVKIPVSCCIPSAYKELKKDHAAIRSQGGCCESLSAKKKLYSFFSSNATQNLQNRTNYSINNISKPLVSSFVVISSAQQVESKLNRILVQIHDKPSSHPERGNITKKVKPNCRYKVYIFILLIY